MMFASFHSLLYFKREKESIVAGWKHSFPCQSQRRWGLFPPLIFLFIWNYCIENEYRNAIPSFMSIGRRRRKNIGCMSFLSFSPRHPRNYHIPKAHTKECSLLCPLFDCCCYLYLKVYIHFPNYNPIIVHSSKNAVCKAIENSSSVYFKYKYFNGFFFTLRTDIEGKTRSKKN